MSGLQVTDIQVPELLKKLKRGEWLVPQFQRDLVWNVSDVVELVVSIFEARPIGMATLWEQPDETELPLEPISVPDEIGLEGKRSKFFAAVGSRPAKVWAILDGKQRCTAIAMAFGGLRSDSGLFKFAGRFYLNVSTEDPTQRVVFMKDSEIKRRRLENDAVCIASGFFPLNSSIENEEIFGQWMRYLQAIRSQEYYKDGVLPDEIELSRRDKVLKTCFQGLVETKLAVYIVPPTYVLADICDIFEKLNTTGTKVSTVDLIHSWIYADTVSGSGDPILLRDWMDELGQVDGAVGWASSKDRPELIAQIVTACYIASDSRPAARRAGREGTGTVSAIKSGDLLAVPTSHWRTVIGNTRLLAEFLRDFQDVVAGGLFPYSSCPYPVVSAIYVALRWHDYFDHASTDNKPWGRTELDALFRAFFWRNALINRYDQGFLSKLGTDLKELRSILDTRPQYSSVSAWATSAEQRLREYVHTPPQVNLPEQDALILELSYGRPSGAALRTYTLPMIATAASDLVDPTISLRYPSGESVELHHIYPKAWCNNSKSGSLRKYLDVNQADRDWVNSIANLMPLSRKSNNSWKIALPGQIISQQDIKFEQNSEKLRRLFVDKKCFDLLKKGIDGIPEFWIQRANLIAADILRKTNIIL